MSISFAPELGDAVREAAERAGKSLSAWLAEAAEAKLLDAGALIAIDLRTLCGAAGNKALVLGC
jgi:hypothetical protein